MDQCPACGDYGITSTIIFQKSSFAHFNFEYKIEFCRCSNCGEEWYENNTDFPEEKEELILTKFKELKYDPEVAKFFDISYSDLKGSTVREKGLILAMVQTFKKLNHES